MICEICYGAKVLPGFWGKQPCHECGGTGIVSCCDAAGSNCASNEEKKINVGPEAAYRDDTYEERACDRCGAPYRGPAVYCSFSCALADA